MDINRHSIDGRKVLSVSRIVAVEYLAHTQERMYTISSAKYNQLKKEFKMAKIKMTGQKVTRTSSSGRSSQKENSSKDVSGRKK